MKHKAKHKTRQTYAQVVDKSKEKGKATIVIESKDCDNLTIGVQVILHNNPPKK